jgi:hypothetical protein
MLIFIDYVERHRLWSQLGRGWLLGKVKLYYLARLHEMVRLHLSAICQDEASLDQPACMGARELRDVARQQDIEAQSRFASSHGNG